MNCLAVRSLLDPRAHPPWTRALRCCNDLAICLKLGLFAYLRAGHVDGFADIYCLKAITPAQTRRALLPPHPLAHSLHAPDNRQCCDATRHRFWLFSGNSTYPIGGKALKFYALTLIVEMFNCFVIIAGSYCLTHTHTHRVALHVVCVFVCVQAALVLRYSRQQEQLQLYY